MNILFIIGNGFDINLDLKTSYLDFYSYYKKQGSDKPSVSRFKSDIDKEQQDWSDLELALGRYTKSLSSSREFHEVYVDIVESLGDYLQEVEDNFDSSKCDADKLLKDFLYPEVMLRPADREKVVEFKNRFVDQWNVNLLTFNYTNTIEKLTNYTGSPLTLKGSKIAILQSIEHVHGTTQKNMVLGVDGIHQVANESFHHDQGVLDSLIKSDCYNAQKLLNQRLCSYVVDAAHLICVFGSSIGLTDQSWWKQVGARLKDENTCLIIFTLGEGVSERMPQYSTQQERNCIEGFLDKAQLPSGVKDSIRDRVFISINSNLFKIRKLSGLLD